MFLAATANPVVALFGKQRATKVGQPVGDTLACCMHAGGHGAVPSDLEIDLKFIEQHLKP